MDSVPPKDVKNVWARMRFFKQYGLPLDPFDPEQTKPRDIPNVYVDGMTRDSKSEMIISLFLDLLKVAYYYNTELSTSNQAIANPISS